MLTKMKEEKNKGKQDVGSYGVTMSRKQVWIVAIAVVLIFCLWQYASLSKGFGGSKAVWIRIPGKASAEVARDSIVSALGDDFGGMVARLWNGNVGSSQGAYLVNPGETAWAVARKISRGRQTPVRVTFNNVRTFDHMAELLASKMDFTKSDFLKAVSEIEDSDSVSHEQLVAQFLPDTYETYWNSLPRDLIGKIRRHYYSFWNEERKDKAETLGLTPLQVSVLASIVEEESNRRDERPIIARLYLNRLQRGMLLQADPTVKFAWGDPTVKRITGEMLDIDSPYNTYKFPGLPPGVIRLPEAATLDAVLDAPDNDYIYMCARPDGSGYHDFTSDYRAHLRNAAKYRRATFSAKK